MRSLLLWQLSASLTLTLLRQTYLVGVQSSSTASSISGALETRRKPTPPTQEDFDSAFAEIKNFLPAEQISTNREDLITHGASSWTYHDPKVLPGAVLYPRHTEDVVGIVKAAHKYSIPIVPFSGGSEFA